ncbi:uncharacterized protein LOC143004433 [Genypterus blacodes]|uniref:uncharacterized protein LOC143004433 n=1 Tax=Genypterus blacodes TaxID=154954 RepID=UPI003F766315
MNEFEGRVAELVRGYPHLYDRCARDFKDPEMSSNSWVDISRELGVNDPNLCKTTWRNVRDKFSKAMKRLKRKSGDGIVDDQAPKLYKELTWLCPFIKLRQIDTSLMRPREIVVSGDDMEEEREQTEQQCPMPVVSTSYSLAESCPLSYQEAFGPKRRRQAGDTSPADTLATLATLTDEDELFLRSLLPAMRRLTNKQRMEVRMRFQQVLYETEFPDSEPQ